MGWENHRNAKPKSRAEKISEGLANFGRERVKRQNMDSNAYREAVEHLRSARGGSTPAHKKPEKLSWSERRAADRILRDGKQKNGKK